MNDDPLQRGTPPGSLRYFAVLYAPEHARPMLQALYAYEAEIRDTLQASHHDVAHTRLQYWRGEVDRLIGGGPQHPVTVRLLPLRDLGADLSLLHEVLAAADFDLARVTLHDDNEVAALAYRATGSLQTLAAIASRGSATVTDAEREFARRLGCALAGVEALRDLRTDVMAGRVRLPLDDLEHAGIEPTQLLLDPAPPGLVPLLERRKRRLAHELQALPDVLTRDQRAVHRQGLVLGALHARLLDRLKFAQGVASDRAEVPPWSRFWIAWRTALSHA